MRPGIGTEPVLVADRMMWVKAQARLTVDQDEGRLS